MIHKWKQWKRGQWTLFISFDLYEWEIGFSKGYKGFSIRPLPCIYVALDWGGPLE